MQIGAHARQLLTIIGGELRQLQLVHARFIDRVFRLARPQLRLTLRRRGGGAALNATIALGHRATRVGLLLRKLRQRVADLAGAVLLLLRLAALFQQLAADLKDLLIELSAAHAAAHAFAAVV